MYGRKSHVYLIIMCCHISVGLSRHIEAGGKYYIGEIPALCSLIQLLTLINKEMTSHTIKDSAGEEQSLFTRQTIKSSLLC